MLEVKDIIKTYGTKTNPVPALKGVSLNFRRAEFVSILGPSGCGKTTLLNVIGGLDNYDDGNLIIGGVSTKDFKDGDWDAYRNNSIGFVFQNYNLISHQTVLHNVEMSLTLSGVSKKERHERAKKALEQVGLADQCNKLPNQMSGGQMQRVAIARALVNNPQIVLADEPTGALDSETSVQVLEILKEVAKDRLVIMVTHNAELAEKYSTRIIKMLDGKILSDSKPLTDEEVKVINEEDEQIRKDSIVVDKKGKIKKKKKPSMSFFTALALSFKNLLTKKTRTILTAFAGSIGIIGIALVLALSNGLNTYIANLQTNTLSAYPISISATTLDMSNFQELISNSGVEEEVLTNVHMKETFNKFMGMMKTNDISAEYTNYLKTQISSDDYYDIIYDYGVDVSEYMYTQMNFDYTKKTSPADVGTNYQFNRFMAIDDIAMTIERTFGAMLDGVGIEGLNTSFVRQYIPTISEMPNSQELLDKQYDMATATSRWPTKANEIVVVVDEANSISDITLALLGYTSVSFNSLGQFTFNHVKDYTIEEIIGQKFYLFNNDQKYVKDGDKYVSNDYESVATAPSGIQELSIVGIVKLKSGVDSGMLDPGIAYSHLLKEQLYLQNRASTIVTENLSASKAEIVGTYFYDKAPFASDTSTTRKLTELGSSDKPLTIDIYAKNFEAKERIKAQLDNWNDVLYKDVPAKQVAYSDTMSMLFSALNTLVDAVSAVLIAFTAISLVVSSIMIGIITYISVVERTKEIGVLRALGASKLNVSNVFNAETIMIGFAAGLLGIILAYILCAIANAVLATLLTGIGALASLRITHALLLIGISILLTFIAGLIPASLAAKRDPVKALRNE